MGRAIDRHLPEAAYERLTAEVLRAAVELSNAQLMELTDRLHDVIRRRRPGQPARRPGSGFADERRSFTD
ncbi:MAG: hypothetical protein KKG14_09295 [Alphaproteobacteria bacterium]|nr:hypothetical protein [Alphaproteobacteria bacterium]MBU2269671.1 hypothetical protein [Alphaproteobacteria bacterium]MBU2418881.1 hypothetical protein [Alphaproteobacteria bacterium]